MANTLVVFKGRTNIVPVSLGIDVSGDVITSDIRTQSGTLIASWTVDYDNDGSDGEIILTLDNSVTTSIQYATGFMDLKRISSGEPIPVFANPLQVEFRDAVTP